MAGADRVEADLLHLEGFKALVAGGLEPALPAVPHRLQDAREFMSETAASSDPNGFAGQSEQGRGVDVSQGAGEDVGTGPVSGEAQEALVIQVAVSCQRFGRSLPQSPQVGSHWQTSRPQSAVRLGPITRLGTHGINTERQCNG